MYQDIFLITVFVFPTGWRRRKQVSTVLIKVNLLVSDCFVAVST